MRESSRLGINAVKRGASALGFLSSSQWASVRTHIHGKICSQDLIVGGLARKRRKIICEGFNVVLKYCLRLLNRGKECWTAGESYVKNLLQRKLLAEQLIKLGREARVK